MENIEPDEILIFPEPRSTKRILYNFKNAIKIDGEYFGTGFGLFLVIFLMGKEDTEDRLAVGINKTTFEFIF